MSAATVPAWGYSAEAFAIAAELVRGRPQTYSGQNFDRAQTLALWITGRQRAGSSIGAARSAIVAAIAAGMVRP